MKFTWTWKWSENDNGDDNKGYLITESMNASPGIQRVGGSTRSILHNKSGIKPQRK